MVCAAQQAYSIKIDFRRIFCDNYTASIVIYTRSQACTGGDGVEQKEIVRLYEAYSEDVFRLALSYLHNKPDAEDVCQSVFNKMIRLKKPLVSGKEKSWLLTCTANECKNHLKSFWRKNVDELEGGIVYSTERDRELWEAFSTLKAKYRAVIHLYYYEGYSQDEIAGILNISRTAVQTRMSRARNQLKEVLSSYE